MNLKNLFIAAMLAVLFAENSNAGTDDFDFTSQRSEIQSYSKVPGFKKNHEGPVINPLPHEMTIDENGAFLDLSGGVRVRDVKNKFISDLDFLKKSSSGCILKIDYGKKYVKKYGIRPVSGAYFLSIGLNGIRIAGYDETGAFYGIKTLNQILCGTSYKDGRIPYLKIKDYPDLPYRGVVEGFYGTPWTHQVRLSLIDFYGKYKMNTYLYGPKDDPYHSCPDWRKPYPEKEAADIRELVERCNKNRVDFVWAIHPGQDIKWNEEDYANLINKFNKMYDLGVRSFAIFFDDISGEGTNPVKQTELLNRLTKDFVNSKKDVKPFTVCPTDYSKLWANPTEKGSLAVYGNTLDKGIKVFWTGDVVCSDVTKSTLDWVNQRIKRPAYFWWNFPVTDYVKHIILQGPVYGLQTTLTSSDLCGIVSNPMEHGEASKLALYGVADYAWNIADYNPLDNWERGLEVIAGKAKDAYRTFAIHSCDTENGYRRSESWETETFSLQNWNKGKADSLNREFDKIIKVRCELENNLSNRALLQELSPWLSEFEKLGKRCKNVLELMEMYHNGAKDSLFWSMYVKNMMSDRDRKLYNAHKSGTMKLQPFYERGMDDMADGFIEKQLGRKPVCMRATGSFETISSLMTKLMFDGDSSTYYTSGTGQKSGDWIGADLGIVTEIEEINILQGRNSVDDVDYFDHAALEYSKDGKNWYPLIEDMRNQYVIRWKGKPVSGRYVRLKRLDSEKANYAAVRMFEINPVHVEDLGFKLSSSDLQSAAYAFDNRIDTEAKLGGCALIDLDKPYSELILLMSGNNGLIVSQSDKKGKIIRRQDAGNSLYSRIKLQKECASICIEGSADIAEIILK